MNIQDVVVSSRIRFARNINSLPFPHLLKGVEPKLQEFLNTVHSVCASKFDGDLYTVNNILIGGKVREGADDYILNMLIENHLISPTLGRSQLGGAIISKDKSISVMFNEEDHLREQCILDGFRLKEAYERLLEVDLALHDRLDIAYKKGFGHLTACPTNLGAGMRASVMMFLPALELCGDLRRLVKKYASEDVTIRGVYGEGSEAKGFMYQISNQASIGWSENQIIEKMESIVNELCRLEEQARRAIWDRKGVDLEDQIMRAYGTLLFARVLGSDEFMINIASVKLGVGYGLLKLDIPAINRLIPKVLPYTMSVNAGKALSPHERDVRRAKIVRDTLIESKIR
ncbi:MAG: ATP--guanido phosphotransferase [Clostridia bacterium]|nr:ATP--guanido phosphotransferase [Clostridia bacterium]MDE6472144.1 ATP--guanido phosphotransferase [Clostridia bacterium]